MPVDETVTGPLGRAPRRAGPSFATCTAPLPPDACVRPARDWVVSPKSAAERGHSLGV